MKYLHIVIVVLTCSFSIYTQDKFSTTVELYVQHDDKNIVDEMTSYITREIRSLGDVTIVSKNADYAISVIMVDVITGNRKIAYAMSINYTKSAQCTFKDKYFDNTPLIDDHCEALVWNSTYASSLDALKSNGAIIAAKFDTRLLAPERDFFNNQLKLKKALDTPKP